MTEVCLSQDKLVVEMQGWEKFWAFKSRLEFPFSHVTGVRPGTNERVGGLRLPGTHLPGVITAGSYWKASEWTFWAVHDIRRSIVIDLQGAAYRRLIVQVADPAATIASLQGPRPLAAV